MDKKLFVCKASSHRVATTGHRTSITADTERRTPTPATSTIGTRDNFLAR